LILTRILSENANHYYRLAFSFNTNKTMRQLSLAFIGLIGFTTVLAQPKTDWFNEEFKKSEIAGAEVNAALELVGDRALTTVIVAVIDDGVDIYHEDFEGKIWVNTDEIAGNGIDDDGNGYIDDVNGWNYMGNPEGENIKYETLEITRLYRTYDARFNETDPSSLDKNEKKEYEKYLRYKTAFEEALAEVEGQFQEYAQLAALYQGAQGYFAENTESEEYTIEAIESWEPEDGDGQQVKAFLLMAEKEGLGEYIKDGGEYFESQLEYNLNLDFDPRPLVNEKEFPNSYGNNMVWAESPDHGTHVAGIIAAKRGNDSGIDGIAPNALIMPLRAVPGGDERDKDIALAIRYAVDNGAKVINMSFGKGYSPEKELVEDAIKYAMKNDVLLIHAAGNDAVDNDLVTNYPDGTLGRKKSAKTLLTIAAANYDPADGVLAEFSNFGKSSVDLLAPGVDILSLAPENGVKSQSGTSMAAPVVSGIAALIRGLDPSLSAKKVKKLLIKSANNTAGAPFSQELDLSDVSEVLRNPSVVSASGAVRQLLE
jgi:subtilisin family serine protease